MKIKVNGKEYKVIMLTFNSYEECYYYYVEGEEEPFNDNDHNIEIID